MEALRHPGMEAQSQLVPLFTSFFLHSAAGPSLLQSPQTPGHPLQGPNWSVNELDHGDPKKDTTLDLLKLLRMTQRPAYVLFWGTALSHREHHSGPLSLGTLGLYSSLQWPSACAVLEGQTPS